MPPRSAGTTDSAPPCAESVREELQRVLSSKGFATATRLRRFLTYAVEETLAGRPEAVKELVVGIEVFDRPSDFDPRTDTIVRVEARELRKRLQEYYDTEGAESALRIEMPKGSYVPQFHVREQAQEPAPQQEAPEAPTPPARLKYVVAVLVLLLAAGAIYWRVRSSSARATPAAPSIAVLPLLNFSSDPANEYIADGLAEDLTDALAHVPGIRVASRTSAFAFKGKQADVRDIGTKLHVDFVVEGSIRKNGERMKVTAQLVRTDDGYHVWSRSFERDVKDVLEVEQAIADSVCATLEQKLTRLQGPRPGPHTASAQAFDLYLRGRHQVNTGVPTDIGPAERLFQQAIAADPEYPRPYVALAKLYMGAEILNLRPTRELVAKAKDAIGKALALDDRSAEVHALLGSLTARHEYDWAAAERHFRDALELDPNSAVAHEGLAQNVLAPQARWQEAVAENRRAMELDPFSPEISAGQLWLLYLQRKYDMATQAFQRVLAGSPDDPAALTGLSSALMGKGDYAGAIGSLEKLQRMGGSVEVLAWIGYCYARLGQTDEAMKTITALTARARTGFVAPSSFALTYIGLQDRDRAIEYLESARENQDALLLYARVGDVFDPIRADPRFSKLLEELGLTDEAILKNQELTSRTHR